MTRFAPPDLWSDQDDDYDFDGEPRDECDHEESEMDVCTGRVECQICGHRWWATKEEVDAELDRMAAYDEWVRQQESRWGRLKEWLRSLRFRLRYRWDTRHWAKLKDDEIPF